MSRQPETPARSALWLVGLLLVLAGLFGMHGLDSHGPVGTGTAPSAMVAGASALEAGHAAMTSMDRHVAAASDRLGESLGSARATMGRGMTGEHGAMPGGGMCMAILVVTLMTLLRLLSAATERPLLWVSTRSTRALRCAGREPDPPSLTTLSIRRC